MAKSKQSKPTKASGDVISELASALEVSNTSRAPHLSELCDSIVSQFGGAAKFAAELHSVYLESPAALKTQVMRMVVKLIEQNTEMGGTSEDLNKMEEGELRMCLMRELGQAMPDFAKQVAVDNNA